MRGARSDKKGKKRGVEMPPQPRSLSAAASAQIEALRNMEDNQPIPLGRPKPKLVVDIPPKPQDLVAYGVKIRDFKDDKTVERARPVWTQQIQPTGPSEEFSIKVRARPKTPETVINTPMVTPNGSYLWPTKEDELAAMSQKAGSQARPQRQASQTLPLTKDLTQETTNTPVASSSKLPTTSSSKKFPTTPIGARVSVIFNAPNKLKRKLRHSNGSSDTLPEPKPAKLRRRIPKVDNLPVPGCTTRSRTRSAAAAEAAPAPYQGRILRPRAKVEVVAARAEISCRVKKSGASARPLRNPNPSATGRKGTRARRS